MAQANSAVAAPTAPPPKPAKLTPQRENFARHIVMGFSQAEAYRRSFVVKEDTRQSSIWTRASILAADRKVALRIAELKAQAAERAVITNATMLEEMAVNRAFALDTGKLSVAQAASRDRAKLAGVMPGQGGSKPPEIPEDAAARVGAEVSIEERSVNEIARRVAFTLAIGRRKLQAMKLKQSS